MKVSTLDRQMALNKAHILDRTQGCLARPLKDDRLPPRRRPRPKTKPTVKQAWSDSWATGQ